MTLAALQTFLAPLISCLAPEGVSEVSINKPQEAWIETHGEIDLRGYASGEDVPPPDRCSNSLP